MKRLVISAVVFIAMAGAVQADTCDAEQIAHALRTYETSCSGSLTSYGSLLAGDTNLCVTQLEDDLQDMSNNGDVSTGDLCAAAEDQINGYASDNNVSLIN